MELRPTWSSHRWLNQDPTRVGVYGNWDAHTTAALHPVLWRIVEQDGNGEYAKRWLNSFVPVVKRMQRRGFGHIDQGTLEGHRTRIDAEVEELDEGMMRHTKLFTNLERECVEWSVKAAFAAAEGYVERIRAADAWAAEKPRRTASARQRKALAWKAAQLKKVDKSTQSRVNKIEARRASFFNMTKDLETVVFDELGLRPAPKTNKRPARSLQQEALLYIREHLREKDQHAKPFLDDLFHRSRLRTIRDRYLQLWPGPDGRIFPTIKCYGTETLRLAYAKPALHQWPRPKPNYPTIRDIIRPRPGYVFVGRDYSQIEAKIFAIETGDQPLLDLFAKGIRIHDVNARQLFGISEADWAALSDEAKVDKEGFAKSFFYGVAQYGGQAETVSSPVFCPCYRCVDDEAGTEANLSKAEKRNAQDRWMSEHPAVPAWRREIIRSVQEADYVYTSRFGFRRRFLSRGPSFERELFNFPMQHGAAGVINDAMVRLDALGAPLVMQMHDELLVECPKGDAQAWSDTLGEEMERGVPEYNGYSFSTKGHIGETWAECK